MSAAEAETWDAIVVGGGIAGLAAAKKGSTIKVNLSKGSKDGTVPNLIEIGRASCRERV